MASLCEFNHLSIKIMSNYFVHPDGISIDGCGASFGKIIRDNKLQTARYEIRTSAPGDIPDDVQHT